MTQTPTGVRVELRPAAEAFAFAGLDHPLQRIAVTEVTLREGELLAEIELATVSGEDRRAARGLGGVSAAHVLGHEQVGRIIALGPGSPALTVDAVPLAVGDRIVWAETVPCGHCLWCSQGKIAQCLHLQRYGHERVRRGWELSGGIATHAHLLARTAIVRARDWIPAAVVAPASGATASAVAAVDAAEQLCPLADTTVLVSGCSTRGLTAIALARSRGARVIAVDDDRGRRTLAHEFGAADTYPSGAAPDGARVTLEFSGHRGAVADALAGTSTEGGVILAGRGAVDQRVEIALDQITTRQLLIRGVHGYRPENLLDAVAFLERADHALFERLVGETVAFSNAAEALTRSAATGTRIAVHP